MGKKDHNKKADKEFAERLHNDPVVRAMGQVVNGNAYLRKYFNGYLTEVPEDVRQTIGDAILSMAGSEPVELEKFLGLTGDIKEAWDVYEVANHIRGVLNMNALFEE